MSGSFVRRSGRPSSGVLVVAAGLGLLWLAASFAEDDSAPIATLPPEEDLPMARRDGGYVSSVACVDCHADEHASWKESYHRTMTQVASPESVLGRFDGSEIDSSGVTYRVFQRDGAFWAEMPDPDLVMDQVQMGGREDRMKSIAMVERQVVMTTGSHHYQTYWVAGDDQYGRLLQTLPLVYLPGEDRWIPREEAFMRPPGDRFLTQWNHHCIKCHSTGGVPGLVNDGRRGKFETRVAELGIACEACHGPGENHVRKHLDLAGGDLATAAAAAGRPGSSEEDTTIANPARMPHDRSSQVCGQCHGVFVVNDAKLGIEYATEGERYRPGDDIHDVRYYIQHPGAIPGNATLQSEFAKNREFFRERWWDDGSILAGGREYTAMSASACYLEGEMSCLSCHSMHDSDPADQLKRGLTDNAQCTQCHGDAQYTTDIAAHSHHPVDSAGSNCLNCHMPYNAYALFSGIRSHKMGSPDVAASLRHGTPNACNLCHLDQTLDWAQRHTNAWYGKKLAEADEDQRTVAAGVLWMLKGDAAQRAIAVWSAGWAPAQQASGTGWIGLPAARLLADPYSVVRQIAGKTLRGLEGYEAFDYDAFATEGEYKSRSRAAMVAWLKAAGNREPIRRAELLFRPNGKINAKRFDRLYKQRNNRPVTIKE